MKKYFTIKIKYLQIKATAIDSNILACELTLENARNLKIQDKLTVVNATLQEDATIKILSNENISNLNNETFDFIVSNPPYVPTKQIFKLMPEIKL